MFFCINHYLEEVLGIDNKNKIYEEHHETSVDLPIIESVQKVYGVVYNNPLTFVQIQ
jgi:hypothetical protein